MDCFFTELTWVIVHALPGCNRFLVQLYIPDMTNPVNLCYTSRTSPTYQCKTSSCHSCWTSRCYAQVIWCNMSFHTSCYTPGATPNLLMCAARFAGSRTWQPKLVSSVEQQCLPINGYQLQWLLDNITIIIMTSLT